MFSLPVQMPVLLKFSLQPFPFVPNALCLGFVSATSMKSSSAFFMSSHENCTCGFCIDGQCKVVFESDMDLHWCMHHLLCSPSKLYSQTSRNLFPPVSSCLDGHCEADTSCFFFRTSTIFQCPKSALYSDNKQITFEQCVNEDQTASAYAFD